MAHGRVFYPRARNFASVSTPVWRRSTTGSGMSFRAAQAGASARAPPADWRIRTLRR